MKLMQAVKRYGTPAAVGTGLMAFAVSAQAAVPAEVTTALGDAKTDAVQVAGIVLGVVVAIFAFRLMRRSLG